MQATYHATDIAVADGSEDAALTPVMEIVSLPGLHLANPICLGRAALYSLVLPTQEPREALLKALTGELIPPLGALRFLGRDVAQGAGVPHPAAMPEIAFVRREGDLVASLNVWENIALPVTYHRHRSEAELRWRTAAALRELGLPVSFGTRMPAGLSALERCLAGYLRALAIEPELMVLDNVFFALDAREMRQAAAMYQVFARWLPFRTLLHVGAGDVAVPSDVTVCCIEPVESNRTGAGS